MPILVITTSYTKADWDDDESYYQVCFSVYCTSYCCGVSVHLIITSIMHYHLYFTVRRLLKGMDGGEKMSDISREFNAEEFYKNMIYRTNGAVVYRLFPSSIQNDYKQRINKN